MYEKTSIGAQKVSGFDENTPESLIAARNDEQRHFFENSRLGIPDAWHQVSTCVSIVHPSLSAPPGVVRKR